MKIASRGSFWPLRPTLTARRLEFSCWLTAGLLAFALASLPATPAGPRTLTLRALGTPHGAELAFRQHCIARVLAQDLGETEDYVVRQINRQCLNRRRTASRRLLPFSGYPKQASIAAEIVSTR
jgi:hypothetical protein